MKKTDDLATSRTSRQVSNDHLQQVGTVPLVDWSTADGIGAGRERVAPVRLALSRFDAHMVWRMGPGSWSSLNLNHLVSAPVPGFVA